jgi:hypothetical protein
VIEFNLKCFENKVEQGEVNVSNVPERNVEGSVRSEAKLFFYFLF